MHSPEQSGRAKPADATGGRWFSVVLLAVTAVFFGSSLDISATAARVPQLTLLFTMLILLLHALLAGSRQVSCRSGPVTVDGAEAATEPGASRRSILPALLWLAVMLASLWLLGVSAGVTVFCLAYLRWYARESWLFSFVFAFSLGSVVQSVFGFAMQAPLYRGILQALLASAA